MRRWKTAPISPTCEKHFGEHKFCGGRTRFAYPADGGGWMALCETHGRQHLPHISPIEKLIEAGETFEARPDDTA